MQLNSYRVHLAHPSEADAEKQHSPVLASSVSSARIVSVILSGGGGTRLWPFSTKQTPKQFLPLINNRTLFEEALGRVGDRRRFFAPVVVGSTEHAELCAGPLQVEDDGARLVLEPCSRNTAPAIVMAAAVAAEVHGDDAVLLVMPSDHVIEDVTAFHQAIDKGEPAARAGRLVTFGVRPTGPETGYGYVEMGADISGAPDVKEVARFVEKPPLELAQRMVLDGGHLWNAGIFLMRATTLMEQAALTCPAIAEAAQSAIRASRRDGIRITPDRTLLADCPSESIDYAVMERSSEVAVVPMSPGWSDVGSWDALAGMFEAASPVGPITVLDCEDCYIRSDGVQIAALGVRDLIIVAWGGRLLIIPRGRSQEVKKLLSVMEASSTDLMAA